MHLLKGASTKKAQGQERSKSGGEVQDAKKHPKKEAKKHLDHLLCKAMATKNQYFLVTGAVNSLQKKVASHEAPPEQISL